MEKDLEREEQREDSEHGDRENGPAARKQLKHTVDNKKGTSMPYINVSDPDPD